MQPYRTARVHDAAACPACAPDGPGHHLCQGPGDCAQVATVQTRRHATAAEYDAIPDTLRPRDGYAMVAVFGCDDCADGGVFDPFCVHAPAPAPPCPRCGAQGEQPCTKNNGGARAGWHSVRAGAPIEVCRHAHRADCEVFTGCQCTGDDPPPVRTGAAA